MGGYVQAYTLYSSVRPFGISAILGSADEEVGPELYMIESSGMYWGYNGAATGKGRQLARNELEKLDLEGMSTQDAIKAAARIIHSVHDDTKDKEFELEIGFVTLEDGEGYKKGLWTVLEGEALEQVSKEAKEAVEAEDEMEE